MGAQWMTVVGGALELIGFALVVIQLARLQRQEFGWPRFIVRSWRWTRGTIRRLLRRPRIVHAMAVDMAGTSDVAGRLSIRKGMGPRAFDRFAAIEFIVAVADAPDDETLAAGLLATAAAGNIRTTTMRAFSADEMRGIASKVS
jgi:hypothetical protein